MRWLILCSTLLAACSPEKPSVARTPAQRVQDAELATSRTPVPRTYRIDGNELKVLEFPVADRKGFIDMHRCFVWRDAEFRQASMTCAQVDAAAPTGHPRD